jgi:hypothetical protein
MRAERLRLLGASAAHALPAAKAIALAEAGAARIIIRFVDDYLKSIAENAGEGSK